ncbi:MAG: DNA polymerase III subunit delta [Anaerolineales bacterium]|jgi:DNA polymerase-3 subunit delta
MGQQKKPSVYLFYGDDHVAINEKIADLKSRIGDPAVIDLNFLALDGRTLSIEHLETAGRSMPFLAERRLTVVKNPMAAMQSDLHRKRVLSLLETLPDESAVVLAEYGPLPTEEEKRDKKKSWLKIWAKSQGSKVYIKEYSVPGNAQLTGWILRRARKMGGEFEPRAANSLSTKVGENVNLAEQEIIKLLTYVNYQRPVSAADVEELTAILPEGGIFDFVDALGNRDRRKAVIEFHRLLADNDIQSIFPMIVRQFRLLVQSREIIDHQGGEQEITSLLKVHPYVGQKLAKQVNHFTQPQLDSIFHQLLEIDSRLKLGKMDNELSIDLLIAELT